jgi:hypothetical protein
MAIMTKRILPLRNGTTSTLDYAAPLHTALFDSMAPTTLARPLSLPNMAVAEPLESASNTSKIHLRH